MEKRLTHPMLEEMNVLQWNADKRFSLSTYIVEITSFKRIQRGSSLLCFIRTSMFVELLITSIFWHPHLFTLKSKFIL
jgi:hypothetical protein